jgi:MinD-like ATPase involved in chromosome partitioning or flagellar assembly
VLLIDGDVRGGSISNHFVFSEMTSGLSGAIRVANQHRFDLEQLERLSMPFGRSSLRVMPGFTPGVSAEINQEAMAAVLETGRSHFDFTVVDLGSINSESPELAAERFTESVISLSNKQLFVCLADPVGIFRLLGTERRLLELSPSPLLIMNRVRNSVITQAKREISVTMERLSLIEIACFLPDEPQIIDQALRTGVPAATHSRRGAFRQALTSFSRAEILGRAGQLDSRMAKLG